MGLYTGSLLLLQGVFMNSGGGQVFRQPTFQLAGINRCRAAYKMYLYFLGPSGK